MKVAVINTGSGSQKCSLFDLPATLPDQPVEPLWEAGDEATGPDVPPGKVRQTIKRHGAATSTALIDAPSDPTVATRDLLERLWQGPQAPLTSSTELAAIAHRVVHGGADYSTAVRVDEKVEGTIQRNAAFAPLHNPANLAAIQTARRLLPASVAHIAVFDTAFHHTLPAVASTYAGPYEWGQQGLRRYGFHGTSFRWASRQAARLLGRSVDDEDLRLIICHLGGGCSLCATKGGRSIDTTMGLTPLDGIPMCTRAGAVDPGILIHLLRQGATVDELEHVLNKQSGLHGLSGLEGDTRIIVPRADAGDSRAALAWQVFCYRLRLGLGQMLAALSDLPDAIVFTDVIGESEPQLRTATCRSFAFLGIEIDEKKNQQSPEDADIAKADSSIRVLLVKSREAWQIARECHQVLQSDRTEQSTT